MADPTTIVATLQATLTGTTESIKAAELALENMQKNESFISNLLLIPKQLSLPLNIRKAAALYTKKYAKNCVMEKDRNKTIELAHVILNQLAITSTDILIRRHLGSTLQFLLINDQKCVIRDQLNPHCIKLLEAARTQQDDKINYQLIGFFVQILMSSFVHLTKQLNLFIQNSINIFCQLNIKVFKYTAEAVNLEDRNKIMQLFHILKLYSYTIKIFLKKMLLAQLQTLKLLYDETFSLLLSTSFDFMLKNNELQTHLIFYNQNADQQVIQLFHSIKADYICSLCFLMRAVFIQFKDKQMVIAHPILNSPSLIPSMLNALNQLLNKMPYYKIKSPNLLRLTEQILSIFIVSVRNMFYYQYYTEYKTVLVHGIILKILGFSLIDCQNFTQEPDQFINQLLQIIQMNSNNRTNQVLFNDKSDQIEQYYNLRALAAVLLQAFCKHIDGSLPQVTNFSLLALQNQTSSQLPKSLILLMLSILRQLIIQRQSNQSALIIPLLSQMLKNRNIPAKIKSLQSTNLADYQSNIEYLLILLTAHRFLSKVPQVQDSQISVIFQVVSNLLVNDNVSEALQYSAFDLVLNLCDRKDSCESKFIQILINLIANKDKNTLKCLETLANIITTTSSTLNQFSKLILTTIQILVKVVDNQVQKKGNVDQLLINKCWSVITHICQNPAFVPKLIPQIQDLVMPLLVYIDGQNNFDFQQDILMMMSSFIQKSKSVTQKQLLMFQIIPKLFYSQYQFMFGHSFQTLQIFMFYGSTIISSAPQAIQAIIQMSIKNMNTIQIKKTRRNQAQNCDGVLIIQSLILSCGNAFTHQNWIQVTTAITKRLQNPPVKTHILHSNILATIALILTVGYKAFSTQDCDILLNRVLQNYHCFVVPYSIKLAIISFTQLLGMYELPFVTNKFTNLLDTTLTLMQSYERKQFFDKNPITQEQRDYDVSVTTIYNMIKDMDEVAHFKKKITEIKQKNQGLLQQTIKLLPDSKAQTLLKTMSVAKVHNEKRQIFKIKK